MMEWTRNLNTARLLQVSIHPDPSQQNVIVTGCSNKKAPVVAKSCHLDIDPGEKL
jgi:hypothetical protein